MLTALRYVDVRAREIVSWPIAMLGVLLSYAAEGCLHAAAWLIDMDLEDAD